MSNYYHIIEFEAYCKSCGMIIPNQGTSFSSDKGSYSREELKDFLNTGGEFQCPNCGVVGNSIFTKAVTNKNNNLKFQFTLSLRKENNQISWMPIEGLSKPQIDTAIDEIEKYLRNNNPYLRKSFSGKGIVVVDFLKTEPFLEVSTFELDGFDKSDLEKIIAYFR